MKTKLRGYVTVKEAEEILNLTSQRILVFIHEDRLEAEKVGGVYLIPRKELNRFKKIPRVTGRPSNDHLGKRKAHT